MITKNFSEEEIACRHCGSIYNDKGHLDHMQQFRDFINRPIVIISGSRCVSHDKNLYIMKRGYLWVVEHYKGTSGHIFDLDTGRRSCATDWYIPGMTLKQMNLVLEKFGKPFNGVGLYPEANTPFIHTDSKLRYARWVEKDDRYVSLF